MFMSFVAKLAIFGYKKLAPTLTSFATVNLIADRILSQPC